MRHPSSSLLQSIGHTSYHVMRVPTHKRVRAASRLVPCVPSAPLAALIVAISVNNVVVPQAVLAQPPCHDYTQSEADPFDGIFGDGRCHDVEISSDLAFITANDLPAGGLG